MKVSINSPIQQPFQCLFSAFSVHLQCLSLDVAVFSFRKKTVLRRKLKVSSAHVSAGVLVPAQMPSEITVTGMASMNLDHSNAVIVLNILPLVASTDRSESGLLTTMCSIFRLLVATTSESRLTAAIPMENPYCSGTMDGRQDVFVQQCAGRR